MNNEKVLTRVIAALLILAVCYILWQNKLAKTSQLVAPTPIDTVIVQPQKSIQITTPFNTPLSGDAVIAGVARMVYFEGSFPVKLIDGNDTVVWQGPATALSDWMSIGDVPFNFTIPTTNLPNGNYTLVLTQDDPSGELVPPQLYSISIPISIAN